MSLPESLKPYRVYAAVFLLNLAILAGIIYLLRRDAPRPIPVTQPSAPSSNPTPQNASTPIHVTVSGAVLHPGVLELDAQARVADALQKAGLKPEADLSKLDLTQRLRDGITILVPGRTTTVPAGNNLAPAATSPAGSKLNLNTATKAELEALPRIGPALAQRILDYRAKIGGYTDIAQIKDVNGIGDAIYEDIKELITAP